MPFILCFFTTVLHVLVLNEFPIGLFHGQCLVFTMFLIACIVSLFWMGQDFLKSKLLILFNFFVSNFLTNYLKFGIRDTQFTKFQQEVFLYFLWTFVVKTISSICCSICAFNRDKNIKFLEPKMGPPPNFILSGKNIHHP